MYEKFFIIFILSIICFFVFVSRHISIEKKDFDKKRLINEIQKVYDNFDKVNINIIENRINKDESDFRNKILSTIDIGFSIDKNYILQAKLTVASIMASQYKTTKIRFHFGVTNNFTSENMLKIYELKNKINNLTEFNFYYLKESVFKMKNFHYKGETLPGKMELPIHLSDNIKKLILFDVGDLLVLRDLTEMYNYNMGEYWALGIAEPTIINSFMKKTYNITKYINTGSLLLNIDELKKNNVWDKYTNNRNIKLCGMQDQTLFNIIIPDNKKNYLPFRFGGFTLFNNDTNSDSLNFINYHFKEWFNSNLSSYLPENPKSEKGILLNLYNPTFIHQFAGKWYRGKGLSIYRHLAKYFILLTGSSEEFCRKIPGYCI